MLELTCPLIYTDRIAIAEKPVSSLLRTIKRKSQERRDPGANVIGLDASRHDSMRVSQIRHSQKASALLLLP